MQLSERQHKARKRYLCDSCHKEWIEPGEQYLRYTGVYDGEMVSVAFHPDCRDWEGHLNRRYGTDNEDEWQSLDEIFGGEGKEALDGAPAAVRKRFGLETQDAP